MGFANFLHKIFGIVPHAIERETKRAVAPVLATRRTAGGEPMPVVDFRFLRPETPPQPQRVPRYPERSVDSAFDALKAKALSAQFSTMPVGQVIGDGAYQSPVDAMSIEEVTTSRVPFTNTRPQPEYLEYVASNTRKLPVMPTGAMLKTVGGAVVGLDRPASETLSGDNRDNEMVDVVQSPEPLMRVLATAVPTLDSIEPAPPTTTLVS